MSDVRHSLRGNRAIGVRQGDGIVTLKATDETEREMSIDKPIVALLVSKTPKFRLMQEGRIRTRCVSQLQDEQIIK